MNQTPKNKLKLLYLDILKGFSVSEYKNKKIAIKHFTPFDVGVCDLVYEESYNKAIEKGLAAQNEKLDYLIKEGFWDPNKDNRIFDLKQTIETLKITKSKFFRKVEIDSTNREIERFEKELLAIEKEKAELLELTAETFANKKLNEFYIFLSFYSDTTLNTSFFTKENYDNLEDIELLDLTNFYNSVINPFNTYNLQRISLLPIFFNYFCLTDSAYEFYGKPIINLTFYQTEIFNHGRYFKNLISNSKSKPPEHLFDQPDKLIEWFDSSQIAQEQINKTSKENVGGVSSLVNVSKEDRERLGIEPDNAHGKLVEMAKKKGGQLQMNEIMGLLGK